MKYIILLLCITLSSAALAQTRQDSVTVTPMASVPTIAVDGESVFAMQSIIDGKSKWTKFNVDALTTYLNALIPLTEAEVDAFVSNNGYLTTVSWNDLTDVPAGFLDGIDNTSSGGADWSEITNIPADIADGDDDTTLDEAAVDAFVANNGYLTEEIDGSVTNELQDLSLTGNTLSLTDDATTVDLSTYLDNTDTQLTEAEVDAFVANNGYLTAEVDGSVTNELQDLSLTGNTLSLTDDASPVDLSIYLDDTTLDEAAVDAFVANNGYLTEEIDGSTTNELQTLSESNDSITLSNSGGGISVLTKIISVSVTGASSAIDIQSVRNGILPIDMTSASTVSPVVFTVSNAVTAGTYTFHFQNTANNEVDLPANFLNAAGTAFDGSTTITYDADHWFTCYYDGTNFYCK
jgi:hypothetical protein